MPSQRFARSADDTVGERRRRGESRAGLDELEVRGGGRGELGLAEVLAGDAGHPDEVADGDGRVGRVEEDEDAVRATRGSHPSRRRPIPRSAGRGRGSCWAGRSTPVTTPSTVTVWPAIGVAAPSPCTSAIVAVTSAARAGEAVREVKARAPAAMAASPMRRRVRGRAVGLDEVVMTTRWAPS